MRCGRPGAAHLAGQHSIPAMTACRKEKISCANSPNSSAPPAAVFELSKVISHFFRKGKLLAVKIPFFIDIEASFETDWNRRE